LILTRPELAGYIRRKNLSIARGIKKEVFKNYSKKRRENAHTDFQKLIPSWNI
jgi:hypothetical protein